MTEEERYWQDKLAQMFHDPFLKALCQGKTAQAIARFLAAELLADPGDAVPEIFWDRWAQEKVGLLLSHRILGDSIAFDVKVRDGWSIAKDLEAEPLPAAVEADLAASGADRPVLGDARQIRVRFWTEGSATARVTHPLDHAVLEMGVPADLNGLLEVVGAAAARLDSYRPLLGGGRVERHRRAWYLMWRRLPEDLARDDGRFWPLLPADTRCPDHSIWDHLRVNSALAFIPKTSTADDRLRANNPGKRPWLLSLRVGPVREFLGAARSIRDLWTGSMILSELAWALIEPAVERLGADAVLYPDLRANLRADLWLKRAFAGCLDTKTPTGTLAALIPNRLIVIVPEAQVEELAKTCLDSARARWREMAAAVRGLLEHGNDRTKGRKLGSGLWQDIFDRQVAHGPAVRWSAVRWVWDGKPRRAYKRAEICLDPAIPFQIDPDQLPDEIRSIEDERLKRLAGWLDHRTFTHYQKIRLTYLMTRPVYLLNQRGFDYAPVHHQLLTLDAARGRLGQRAGPDEPGEKCTLCGCRQALTNQSTGTVGQQRRAARELWRRIGEADRDEDAGAERLCGPCAVRRYLADTDDPINETWRDTLPEERTGGRHPVPFPSTGLIAGQRWLARLCDRFTDAEEEVREAVTEVRDAFRLAAHHTDARRTQFAGSVPRLRRRLKGLGRDHPLRQLLEYDIQTLSPDWWADRIEDSDAAAKRAKRACGELRRVMKGGAETFIAVISLDGDRIGRLLLGDPNQVTACWRHVLHPDAVEQIRKGDATADAEAWKAYWRTSLDDARVLGPSTHAFITRALRHFSNRVLPWVVEREYAGKLIFAGGDDALILCPAADAVPMLTRLDQLFRSPWVLDLAPQATAWPAAEPPDPRFDVCSDDARKRLAPFPWARDEEGVREPSPRIFPLLGRHQSFSAGVAFGPFKTSLRVLRATAQDNRDLAKAGGGRRAGLSWFTSNGAKVHWTAPFADDQAGGLGAIATLATAFRKGKLPGRLPYKLREMIPAARAILTPPILDTVRDQANRDSVLRALVRRALDRRERDETNPHEPTIVETWSAGLETCLKTWSDRGANSAPVDWEASLGGLLIARTLGSLDPDGKSAGASP